MKNFTLGFIFALTFAAPVWAEKSETEAHREIEKALQKLPAKERTPARQMYQLFNDSHRDAKDAQKMVIQARTLLRSWMKAGATPDRLADIIEQGTKLMDYMGTFSGKGVFAERQASAYELLDKIRALQATSPKNSRLQRIVGQLLASAGADELDVIQAYFDCLEMNSTDRICQESFNAFTKKYEEATCDSKRVKPGTEFTLASDIKDDKFMVPIKNDGKMIYGLSKPTIVSEDIAKIFYGFTPDPENFPVVLFELTSRGRRLLESTTEANVGKYFVLHNGTDIIVAPVIKEKISTGKISVSPVRAGSPKEELDDVKKWTGMMCDGVTQNKLPERFVRPKK